MKLALQKAFKSIDGALGTLALGWVRPFLQEETTVWAGSILVDPLVSELGRAQPIESSDIDRFCEDVEKENSLSQDTTRKEPP